MVAVNRQEEIISPNIIAQKRGGRGTDLIVVIEKVKEGEGERESRSRRLLVSVRFTPFITTTLQRLKSYYFYDSM